MLKKLLGNKTLLVNVGIWLAALIGATFLTPKVMEWIFTENPQPPTSISHEQVDNDSSQVLSLAELPPENRETLLEQVALDNSSLENSRARYVLANDYINKYEGGKALLLLKGLELQYSTLGAQILLKRGRAYELTNDKRKAEETWHQLLKNYPDSPACAQALYLLGVTQPRYWDEAINKFPNHPITHQIVRERLKENPHQPPLLLLLAKYDPQGEGSFQARNTLVREYASTLTPEDWEVIALGYWQTAEFEKASQAYAKSPSTPENLYRVGRGLHIGKKTSAAKNAYLKLVNTFPQAEETGLALRRLAQLSGNNEALGYLNQAIQYPQEAPQALWEKIELLKAMGRTSEAQQSVGVLLTQFATADATAEYLWETAQQRARAGDIRGAKKLAQPIMVNNPGSDVAPRAGFWVGKWSKDLGNRAEANTIFEQVLKKYNHSYYAWRSAVHLGWNVGSFTTVRNMIPPSTLPSNRHTPPAGSDAFKELYLLAQDRDAITLFMAETSSKKELSVGEQFTLGMLRQLQGDYLRSIQLIVSLRDREDPQEYQEWQSLRQTEKYWYTLFPFPYYDIILPWSQKRQVNPFLVTALIRQESRFQKDIVSPAGATGLMQVMPQTAEEVAQQINLSNYSLTNPQDNIQIGTWYLGYTHDTYKNNSLLAVASYNAGPGNVSSWLSRFGFKDEDNFVEKIPFKETEGYVEYVFGNYWNYLRLYDPEIRRKIQNMIGGG